MRPLLSYAARSTAVVGAAACAIWGTGVLLGVEAATVTGIVVTFSAGALFGDTQR